MKAKLKWISFCFVFSLVSAAFFFYRQDLEMKEFANWIRSNAIAINANEPFLDSASFSEIAQTFNNSKVIAIGESTHGTHEFDVLKLELLKHLVTKQNCRTVALEAGFSRCWVVNNYLSNDSISTDSLIRIMAYTNLKTIEFKNFIQWIRDHNKHFPSDKIALTGFDIQGNSAAVPYLESFFNNIDVTKSRRLIECVRRINSAKKLSKNSNLIELAHELESAIKELCTSNSEDFTHWPYAIKMFLIVINQYAHSYGLDDLSLSTNKRDSCMALNVLSLIKNLSDNKPILLSAHNGHISEFSENFVSMGMRLSPQLGPNYFTIGLDFVGGSYRVDNPSLRNSPGWETIEAAPSSIMSLSNFFSESGKTNAFLSFKSGTQSMVVKDWIYSKWIRINAAGSASSNSYFYDDTNLVQIGRAFDSIIMIERSTPNAPLK